jgi:hypothetical protein
MASLHVTNPQIPIVIGSMEDYDLVDYNDEELAKIKEMEDCMRKLTSEKYQGLAKTCLLAIHAEKRVRKFKDAFNSSPDPTACTRTITDTIFQDSRLRMYKDIFNPSPYPTACACTIPYINNEPNCMHPGAFDMDRVRENYIIANHCLICGARDCDREDSTCGHKVLINDFEMTIRKRWFRGLCTPVMWNKYDFEMAAWETGQIERWGPPYRMIQEREWQATVAEIEVTRVEFTQKQVERRFQAKCLAMAMGQHPRLGAKSLTSCMDPEILRIVMTTII